jgi:hypothetical protein
VTCSKWYRRWPLPYAPAWADEQFCILRVLAGQRVDKYCALRYNSDRVKVGTVRAGAECPHLSCSRGLRGQVAQEM